MYGLVATALLPEPSLRLYALKGRPPTQPSALMTASLDMLLELVPELRGRSALIAKALLPGPYTLVLPNPARRFRWLSGDNPDAIGVRVPDLPEPTKTILERVSAFVSTSANLTGGPEPKRAEDIHADLRAKVAAVVDGGELPGTPSTVLDFTGSDPRILREGAAPAADAIERVHAALR